MCSYLIYPNFSIVKRCDEKQTNLNLYNNNLIKKKSQTSRIRIMSWKYNRFFQMYCEIYCLDLCKQQIMDAWYPGFSLHADKHAYISEDYANM